MPWKIIARRTRFQSNLGCNLEFRLEENEQGETRKRVFVVCVDGTVRPLERTGLEGALHVACQQVKVNLVTVIEPRIDRRLDDDPTAQHDDALSKIHAIQNGTTNTYEVGKNGTKIYSDIGVDEALIRYGRKTVDVCERIPGGVR